MDELPDWVRALDLAPHPEGGWFRETWRSDLVLDSQAIPADYGGPRHAATAILFVLMPGQQSAWHTVRSAELWMFHRGSPLELEVGADRGSPERLLLGADVGAGEQPQILVPPGHWQRARPIGGEPTLVSCVVAPGFDFADFALAEESD